ncbi:MAG: hypothetical protein ACXWJC_01310 [Croceibacterium sp.]
MGLEELVVLVLSFGFMIAVVDQIRRLIGHAILNRTIRIAPEKDPASAPALIAKLDGRNPIPIALPGVVTLALGLVFGVAAVYSGEREFEAWMLIGALIVIGGVILGWDRRNRMRSANAELVAQPDTSAH